MLGGPLVVDNKMQGSDRSRARGDDRRHLGALQARADRGLQFQEQGAQIGSPVNAGKDLLLANRGTFVLSFTTQQSVPAVQVVASIFYGRVDLYAALGGRDPGAGDFDVSAVSSGMPDLLVVVSLHIRCFYMMYICYVEAVYASHACICSSRHVNPIVPPIPNPKA